MNTFIVGNNESVRLLIGDLLFEEFACQIEYLPYKKELTRPDIKRIEKAELIIIDLTTTKTNSRLLIRELLELAPKAKLIAMHYYQEKELIAPFILAGASAYLLVDTTRAELFKAVTSIRSGNTYISTQV
jgi:DNA-binding NarL/FixJ family response regulator